MHRGEGVVTPSIFHGTPFAAGIDLPFYDPELESYTIQPGERFMAKTGIQVEMPLHLLGLLDSRSSTSKLKLDLLCRTIDCDYRGNIRCVFINDGDEPVTLIRGEYYCQMILLPRVFVTEFVSVLDPKYLESTERGEQGFGHTGNSQAAQRGN
ncbi:Deoxyuridine 5'-triphosphate nucleotidohydrolase [compost metagenome]